MRRRINITNETTWNTRQLRAFVARCAKEVIDDKMAPWLKTINVSFNSNKSSSWGRKMRDGGRAFSLSSYVSGHAYIKSNRMRIHMPPKGIDYIDKVQLAQVIAHELGHCMGLRHRQMKSTIWNVKDKGRVHYEWASELPLERVPEKVKEKKDKTELGKELVAKRKQKVEALVQKWEKKKVKAESAVKKAETMLKKHKK